MEGKKLRIAMLGLGSVGSKVVELVTKNSEYLYQRTGVQVEIVYGLVRSILEEDKKKLAKNYQFQLTDSYDDILSDDSIDVVVELIGRVSPAKEYIVRALKAKKHVVTANKDVMAQYAHELLPLANQHGVTIGYEASVAGGIPIVNPLKTQFSLDTITSIRGILNGTTNFILTKMLNESLSYEEALTLAQELGFAESDPTNDVEGIDAAYKVMILAQLAYHVYPKMEDVQIDGITAIHPAQLAVAKQFGYKIKLLGEVKAISNELSLRVAPALVSDQTSLALIDNETNALQVNSTQIGQSFLSGPGAGAAPTATSVLADIQTLIEKKELGTSNQFTPVFFENLEFTFLAESPAEKMGIVMKKANASQKFTNDQLADIQSIHHVSIADDAYEWLVTNPLTREQLHDLLESLNKMGSVLGALPFVD